MVQLLSDFPQRRRGTGAIIIEPTSGNTGIGLASMAAGPEIWEDTDGQVDIFAVGVDTGGRYLSTPPFAD